jgi:hypothetical protein
MEIKEGTSEIDKLSIKENNPYARFGDVFLETPKDESSLEESRSLDQIFQEIKRWLRSTDAQERLGNEIIEKLQLICPDKLNVSCLELIREIHKKQHPGNDELIRLLEEYIYAISIGNN